MNQVESTSRVEKLTTKIRRELEKKINKLFTVRAAKRKFEQEDKDLTEEVKPLVILYGDKTDKKYLDDSVLLLEDLKVHNCAVSKPNYDFKAGIEFLKAKIRDEEPAKASSWQQLFNSLIVTREDLDTEIFERARVLRLIPEELEKVICKEKVIYQLKIYEQK